MKKLKYHRLKKSCFVRELCLYIRVNETALTIEAEQSCIQKVITFQLLHK